MSATVEHIPQNHPFSHHPDNVILGALRVWLQLSSTNDLFWDEIDDTRDLVM
jgi:hypothetical protein